MLLYNRIVKKQEGNCMKSKKSQGMRKSTFVCLLVLVVLLSSVGIGYFYYKELLQGESLAYSYEKVKDLNEESFTYKIAKLFYTEEEIANIKDNHVEEVMKDEVIEDDDSIEIRRVYGSSYEGVMMIVHNPEDISVAVNPNMATGGAGPSLDEYVKMYNALGGINAGGFIDVGGYGNGGTPWGIVIHKGELLAGNLNEYVPIIGIDEDHRLICVDGTAKDALSWGIQEALTFGPVLINNYQVAYKEGSGNLPMLNPRTGIGQRSDGAFILLTIDGRGPSSFGALYEDIVDVFVENDCGMAANLDGGNSTAMIYDGEYINVPVSMKGSRNLPTVFLVRGDN